VKKNNRFTLIATFLLGVLLYTILQFARDLNVAWDGSALEPRSIPEIEQPDSESSGPIISTLDELKTLLQDSSINPDMALANYADWGEQRGFYGANRLLFSPAEAPQRLATITEGQLQSMSQAGDLSASQELARRNLFTNTGTAANYYQKAARQGSTAALIRLGSLLATISKLKELEDTASQTQNDLAALAAAELDQDLMQTAFAVTLVAVRDGGPPVIDPSLLDWLTSTAEQLSPQQLQRACAYSETLLLDIAGQRLKWNKPAIAAQPPLFFFSVPNLSKRLPCSGTLHPIEVLMDLDSCATIPILNATNEPLNLQICQND